MPRKPDPPPRPPPPKLVNEGAPMGCLIWAIVSAVIAVFAWAAWEAVIAP